MSSLSDSQREALLAELGGLRKFCLSLTGNPSDADDLLQATVERVLEKGMPADAHPAKWAFRVCKNAWIDELRSRNVRQKYPQLVVVDESTPRCGLTADIAALAADKAFHSLKGPVKQVCAPHSPVPFSPELEAAYLPSVEKIAAAILETMA